MGHPNAPMKLSGPVPRDCFPRTAVGPPVAPEPALPGLLNNL